MPPKKATAAAAATKAKPAAGVKKVAAKAKAAAPTATTQKTATKPVAKPSTATKAVPTKAAPKTLAKGASKPAPSSRKRKAEESDSEDEEPQVNGTAPKRAKKEPAPVATGAATKKPASTTQRAASAAAEEKKKSSAARKPDAVPASKAPKATRPKVVINQRPDQILDVYLFGGGESGELGFAGAKGTKEIKRPRLNPNLAADKIGVVQFSVGGMHTAALTHDNKILTWGVNDQGALGRDTAWDGGLKDMQGSGDDDDSDSDSDEGEINPHESTPGEVDFSGLSHVPEFTQVVASDSATFALTDEGLVYGWGTFRSNEGIFGFSAQTKIQDRPALVPGLKKITKLAAGTNHILALDKAGAVYAWGAGQQNQLGRRILERHQISSLTPAKFGLKGKYVEVGAGSFHSFAVKNNGEVFSWGLNSFGQTGIEVDTSEGGPDVHLPTKVDSLSAKNSNNGTVINITGGSHHSIAVTDTGAALAWGRLDGFQVGLDISTLPDDALVRDANNRPRILTQPTKIPDVRAATAAAGSDHSIVTTTDGKAYSFGFNLYGQCGVGTTDDVHVAELIENTAVRGKNLVAAGCGGQFSCLASIHEEPKVNGTTEA